MNLCLFRKSFLYLRIVTARTSPILLLMLVAFGAAPLLSAQVAASPSSVTWGSVAIGNAGGPKAVTLTNKSAAAITISSIGFKGANPGDFSIYQNTCGSKLAASASCTTTILFKPTAAGTRTATLAFTDSGAGSPHQVSVSGLGTGTSPGTPSNASITVNFNSRSGGVSIPANMLGTEYFELLASTADRGTVVAGGFTNERYRLDVSVIFPKSASAPVWTGLDRDMNEFVAAGVHPLMELVYTPTFLRPSPLSSSCTSTPYASVPTSVQGWGHLAALIAAHLDSTHRGLATYYEIWNEPNQAGLCGSSNKLADYEKIYAAAAPQIQTQGVKDGIRLYTGGPGAADVAFTDILTNPSTAPYVDFYSYHFYVTNGVSINRGMNWNGAGGKPSLFAMMQSSTVGVQARYLLANKAVKAAKTLMGANTPIFYDEYNDDWFFANDCCRNSPTYSPLYNSIVVADILNSVYKGANEVPARMIYYAATNPPFCIMGVLDAAMDCAKPKSGQTTAPYPQWYVYKMMFTPSFLDLKDPGHVATSVTLSSEASSAGLIATAFYTSTMDSVLVINPTGSSFSGVSLQMTNPGITGPLSAYIINASNPHIATWPATTTTSSGGVHTTFNLPAYSVVGISLR